MTRIFLVPAALGAIAAAALAPATASAQSFGVYVGSDYPRYDRDERREAWIAHERWEQRARWEQEQDRRRYWARERWENDRDVPRYREEDRGYGRHEDDDD